VLQIDIPQHVNANIQKEVNIKGTFIATKAFLKAADSDPTIPKTIINLASGAAVNVPPGMSTYSMSKMGIIKFTEFLKVEHPTITSVSLDPGCVHTDMGDAVGFLQPFMYDTPGLCGGLAVWLSSGDKSFLSGRYVLANWDVDELEKRKEDIVDGGLLATCLKGKFGGDDIVVHRYSK
jgi:NAD(P)-dependent dehydrogenase (short-subunit alcohol dehydrogenase family)